jgi:hypothetical protein
MEDHMPHFRHHGCPNKPCRSHPPVSPDPIAGAARAAKSRLSSASKTAVNWAAPRVSEAIDWATPRARAAWSAGIQAAAPKVEEAANLLSPKIAGACDKLQREVLPSIVAAVSRAAQVAAVQAETGAPPPPAPKKRHCGRKILAWLAVIGLAGGIAAWLRQRTLPSDDPWSEDAWDEREQADGAEAKTEDWGDQVADAAGDAADAVGEATGVAVRKVQDAAAKAGEAAAKAGEKVAEVARKAGEKAGGAARKAAAKARPAGGEETPSGHEAPTAEAPASQDAA